MKQEKTITVIGLGQMGTALATALLNNNKQVTVWNRSVEKTKNLQALGASVATSLPEALAAGDRVVLCLSAYDDVHSLLLPVAGQLKGKIILNLSTGTYEEDTTMAEWIGEQQALYLSGAAMSGTLLVGRPEALFIYSGSSAAFKTLHPFLESFGQALYLDEDAGHVSLYDMTLFGVIWGALGGFFHGAALLDKKGIGPHRFAETAAGHLSFIAYLMRKYADQIAQGDFAIDEGTLDVHSGAMDILLRSSRELGISTEFPAYAKSLIDQGIMLGYGDQGIVAAYKAVLQP